MEMKAEIVVQSHLSDSLIESHFDVKRTQLRIEFVKYIVCELGGDLSQRIDPEVMYEEFLESKN